MIQSLITLIFIIWTVLGLAVGITVLSTDQKMNWRIIVLMGPVIVLAGITVYIGMISFDKIIDWAFDKE